MTLKAPVVALKTIGATAMAARVFFIVWPSGLRWHPYHPYYEVIAGTYFVLGVFLWRTSANPPEHLSLTWFAPRQVSRS